MKKILTFVLVFILLLTSNISVSAEDIHSAKEEVVYGILHLDGSVNNLYVVNSFNDGEITDYGSYSDVRNMTNSEKLNQNDEQITISTNANKFYYQGTLNKKELPWDIAIKYYLDGKEISGNDLAGKNGNLKMTLTVKQNNKINSNFYENYALQIAFSLENKLFSNIKADNATIAQAGSKKQITYTVLPGDGANITVTADVHDFEMEPITINGIKLSLGISVDTDEFTGEISELTDAIKELDGGAAELLNGLDQLSSGMQEYMNGMKAFKDGLGQLSEGTDKLNTGATALSNGLSELITQNDSLVNGALEIQQSTFDSINAQLNEMGLELPILTSENYSAVLSPIPDLAAVQKQLDGVVQFTQGLEGYMDGVEQLGKGASNLASGTSEFKASSSVIISSANELYKAGEQMNMATKKLRDGLASYKNGTMELRNGTSDMSSEIENKIDEMLSGISGNSDKVISFVSEKNTNVSAVQFVLKTDSISIPEAPKAAPKQSVELSFWQKLLKLFGLYE